MARPDGFCCSLAQAVGAFMACALLIVLSGGATGLFERLVNRIPVAIASALLAGVLAMAGLALLGTIGSGLHTALKDENHREAALITFLVTLSGVVMAGIGFALWGMVAGALALFVQQYGLRKKPHEHSYRCRPP